MLIYHTSLTISTILWDDPVPEHPPDYHTIQHVCIYYHYYYYHYYYYLLLLFLLLLLYYHYYYESILYTYMHYTYIWSYIYWYSPYSVIQSANKSSLKNSTRPSLRCSEHVGLAAAGAFPGSPHPSGTDKRHLLGSWKEKQQKTWVETKVMRKHALFILRTMSRWKQSWELADKYMRKWNISIWNHIICRKKYAELCSTHFPGK